MAPVGCDRCCGVGRSRYKSPPHVPRAGIFARFPQFLTFFTRLLGVGTPGVAPCVPQGGGPPAPWHFGVCTLSPPQPVRLPPSRSPHPAVPEPCKYLGDGASVPPCAPQNPFWALELLTATSAGGKLRHGGCWARTQGFAPMGARSLWATPAPLPLGWGQCQVPLTPPSLSCCFSGRG